MSHLQGMGWYLLWTNCRWIWTEDQLSVLSIAENSSHGKLPDSKGRVSSLLHKPEFPDTDMMEVLIWAEDSTLGFCVCTARAKMALSVPTLKTNPESLKKQSLFPNWSWYVETFHQARSQEQWRGVMKWMSEIFWTKRVVENGKWCEKGSVEEKGNCVFWHKEKVVKLQTGCTLLFSCLYNQDREQNPVSLEDRESFWVIQEKLASSSISMHFSKVSVSKISLLNFCE